MIDATQLQMDNYVKVPGDAGIYRVMGIDGWQRVYNPKDKEQFHDEHLIRIAGGARNTELHREGKLSPVKLTEEWLVRFGFKVIRHITS